MLSPRIAGLYLRTMNSQSRRGFLKAASAAIATTGLAPSMVAQRFKPRMTLALYPGSIGVKANQMEAIRLAAKYGFQSVEAMPRDLTRMSDSQLGALTKAMEEGKIVFGSSGLTVNFKGSETDFQDSLKALPSVAEKLHSLGISRMNTWISPSSHDLTYLANMRRHADRLGQICRILADHSMMLGLEYIGTQTLRVRKRYPFIHTFAETLDLLSEVGARNCGFVLDTWHWWTAGDTPDQILTLQPENIALVDLNDAPRDIPRESVMDNRRELPVATGRIPVDDFLGALASIGYDGPVRAEPFNQKLNELDNDTACEVTITALKSAMSLL